MLKEIDTVYHYRKNNKQTKKTAMTKYDFTASTNQLVKTGTALGGDASTRIQSFRKPSVSLAARKISFFDCGTYMCSLPLSEIGTIAGVAPTDLTDAVTKLINLIATLTA